MKPLLAVVFFVASLLLLPHIEVQPASIMKPATVVAQAACGSFPRAACAGDCGPADTIINANCPGGNVCCQGPAAYPAPGGGGGGYGYPAPGGGGGGYGYPTPYGTPYAYPYPYPAPRYDITGTVWIDNNRNTVRDGAEGPCYLCGLTLSGAGSATTGSSPTGAYSFLNYLAGAYNVTLTVPPGYVTSTGAVRGTTLGPDRVINFGLVPIYNISGFVYNDINKNHLRDNGETKDWPDNITMSATPLCCGNNGGTISINQTNGAYTFSNLFAGPYIIRYTSPIPTGYIMLNPIVGPPPAWQVNVGPCNFGSSGAGCFGGDVINLNFAITNSIPWMQSYGLDMRFDDGFTDIIPQAPVYPPYASAIDSMTGGSGGPVGPSVFMGQNSFPATNNVGATVGGLTAGRTYRVVVSGTFGFTAALHYDAQWSDNGGPANCYCRTAAGPYFNGTFMRARDFQTSHNPAHVYTFDWNANSTQLRLNIEDSNFADNWGSLTFAVYYDPPPPPTPGFQSTTPGIVFTGDGSGNYGRGQASAPNWTVGGSLYSEVYPSATSVSTTSYQYLLDKANHSGITLTNLATVAGCNNLANCTLPANLANGVYQANGNVILNASNFQGNRDYVFLINGDLRVRGNMSVQNGSTAMFSTSRDIIIDRVVGSVTNSHPLPASQVAGLFSAGRDFIVDAQDNCLIGPDRMLNMEGAIVANAAGAGGTFENDRDLCGDNPDVPSFTIQPRVDFLLNTPLFLMKQNTVFKEDAP